MKSKKLMISLLLLISCIFIFAGCNDDYIYRPFESGNITGGYCKHNAFIGKCYWDGGDKVIELPDEYNGVPVTLLGGYTGRLGTRNEFEIVLSDNDYTYIESTNVDDDDYETIIFTIKIGKNLQGVERISDEVFIGYRTYDENYDMNMDVIYKIEYYFEIDSENEYLYSKDGKIYDKSSDCEIG